MSAWRLHQPVPCTGMEGACRQSKDAISCRKLGVIGREKRDHASSDCHASAHAQRILLQACPACFLKQHETI